MATPLRRPGEELKERRVIYFEFVAAFAILAVIGCLLIAILTFRPV